MNLLMVATFVIIQLLFCSFPVRAEDCFLKRPLEFEIIDKDKLLITDGGGSDWTTKGSKVMIVDRGGEVLWCFKDDLRFAHSAHFINDDQILISDSTNDRIIIVDKKSKKIKEELGDFDYPNEALSLDGNSFLVTDRNNDRFLEVDKKGGVLWEYKGLERPHNASRMENGNFLVSDSEANRVLEISKDKEIVWEYGGEEAGLNWPRDVSFLTNGNFLITDTRNNRVLEVNRNREVVWEHSKGLYWPYEAERLENGNTLISDSQNRRIVEVNESGEEVWEYRHDPKIEFNPFENGDFEKTEEGEFENWTEADLLAEGSGKFEIEENVVHSGKRSGGIEYDGRGHIFYLQRAKVAEGEMVDFSGWVRTDLEDNKDSWARFEIWWETEKGGFAGEPLVSKKSFGISDWQKRSWSGKAPKGAVGVNIRCLMTGKGKSWFDDVVFKKEPGFWEKYILAFVVGFTVAVLFPLIFKKYVKDKKD